MPVRLMRLVSAPWMAPCSSGPTCLETRPWTAGPAMPPMLATATMAYIIQPWVARP
ncbi:hypothetical protein D3C86_1449500 [compost metagenome]